MSLVLGQDQALAQLRELWRHGHGPHTIVLAGPEGVGRRPTAYWLAAMLNCTEDDPEARPCGACGACRAILANEHPDVKEVGPRETTRSGRAKRTSEITIDQLVRRTGGELEPLGPWLAQRPRGRMRVGIIDRAESLNVNAGNAFLKVLEEPPSWAVIVLIAAGPEALLPTITSRSTVVRLGPVDTAAFGDLAPHPALRLGQLGPLLAARSEPEPTRASQAAVDAFMDGLGGDLAQALAAAEALAGRLEAPAEAAPTQLLRERFRALPPARYAHALEALEACERSLAAYCNPVLAFAVLTLHLRSR